MRLFFKDKEYSYQFIRTMGQASVGAADIGECVQTAGRISEEDDESWYREWYALAETLDGAARNDFSEDFDRSAGEAFARASTYYRTAASFLAAAPPDQRLVDCWQRSRESFLRATRTVMDHPVRPVEIPFDHITMSGYYCTADNSRIRRPLIVVLGDFDSTAEELYFTWAAAALERCYNCLIIEGPGHGRMLRVHNISFRHDAEVVTGPAVDFALRQPETDEGQIILLGIGMGGYLAARSCAYDQRPAACIVDDGFFDLQELLLKNLAAGSIQQLDDPLESRALDQLMCLQAETSRSMCHTLNGFLWRFGASTASDLLRKSRLFTLRDCIGRIQCPTLVADSEEDRETAGQPRHIFEALAAPKQYLLFSADEGAGEHAQAGAIKLASARIFNWLDTVVKTPAEAMKAEATYWG